MKAKRVTQTYKEKQRLVEIGKEENDLVISFDCLDQYGPHLNPMVFLNFSVSQANSVQLGLTPV